MRRLRRLQRYDTLRNETRRGGRTWGRWLYLAIVCCFLLWIIDGFFGELLYFRAEGIVIRERVVVATQYPAGVSDLQVSAGSAVAAGDLVATLRSREVEERLAELTAEYGDALERVSELRVRRDIINAVQPMAADRLAELRSLNVSIRKMREQQLATAANRVLMINNHFAGLIDEVGMGAEARAIAAELAELENPLSALRRAIDRLRESYADGALVAPVGGIVGYLHASRGSVVRAGEPLMEIFTGPTFIFAYLPDGALYEMQVDDTVVARVGLRSYHGRIETIRPVAAELPPEFQKTFQPVERAQIARIELDPGHLAPPLFAKVTLKSLDFPPAWLRRLVLSAVTTISGYGSVWLSYWAVDDARPPVDLTNPEF